MMEAIICCRDGRLVNIRQEDNKIYLSIGRGTKIKDMEVESVETMEETFDEIMAKAELFRDGFCLNCDDDKPPIEMVYKIPLYRRRKAAFCKGYHMVLEELGIGGEYISSNIGKIYIDAFNGSLYVGVQKEHLKDAENIISEHLLKDFEIEKNGIFYKYKDFFIVGYEIPEEIHFAEKLSARINSLK